MFVLIYFVCSMLSSYAELTQYDQRQTGDVNVQVDLKDLQFFAVLKGDKEEYVDYDYAYDYSELTIKPQNRTTPQPFNGTSASASTEKIDTEEKTTAVTTVQVLQQHAYATNSNNNESTTLGFTVQDKVDSTTVKSYSDVTTERSNATVQNVTADSGPVHLSTRKPCRKGYVLNKKGQCQLKMNTAENALLRLVKLSQKLKSRRGNKSNDNP